MIRGNYIDAADRLLEAKCRIKGCSKAVKPCSQPGLGGLCAGCQERQRERERHDGEFMRSIERTLRPARQRTFDLWNTGPTRPEYSAESEAVAVVLTTLLEGDEADDWIGVDLDGTLAKYSGWKGSTKIGKPIPAMVRRIRRWVSHGKKVKIFTARADDERAVNAIKKWLKDNELPDLEVTNLKDEHMTCLWDDRVKSVEKNTGRLKEAVDEPWGPEWQPSAEQVAWFARLLRSLNQGATWSTVNNRLVYRIDHRAKTLTLIEGSPCGDPHWHEKIKRTVARLGYRVLDGSAIQPDNDRPDEQSFAEAVSDDPLAGLLEDDADFIDDIIRKRERNRFGLMVIPPEMTAEVKKVAHELILRHWDRGEDLVDTARLLARAHFAAYGPQAFEDLIQAAHSLIMSGEGTGEAMESLLTESPLISTLEKHRVDLEPEERAQIMKAKAVWPFGKNGADSPAVHKAVVKGKTWYWSNTHRYGQVSPGLKSAIRAFHTRVEPTA